MSTMQTLKVLKIGLRQLKRQYIPTILIAVAIASSVFVFTICFSLVKGIYANFDKASVVSDSYMLFRKGSDNELGSFISGNDLLKIKPATNSDASFALFGEIATIINAPSSSDGKRGGNLLLRGVEYGSLKARGITIESGELFVRGKREILVGRRLVEKYPSLGVGKTLRMSGEEWKVVGVFSSALKISESELVGDIQLVQALFMRGNSYTTVIAETKNHQGLNVSAIEKATDGNITALPLHEYYSGQLRTLSNLLLYSGLGISAIVCIGAAMGVMLMSLIQLGNKMNMFNVLFSVGIRRQVIEASFILEVILISIGSALISIATSVIFFDNKTISTLNISGFNQISFNFDIGVTEIGLSILIAILIGFSSACYSLKRVANEVRLIR